MKYALIGMALASACSLAAAESTVCAPQKHKENWGRYVQKYEHAEKALACAGFTGLTPKQTGGGSQCVDYVPHRAVKHAAEVDAPVRGRGGALCSYIDTKQNRKWYADNFGIKSSKD